ncbi:MAG: FRG domain-containing protein [Verrucomicrobiales bacterium]|nr:FRG domain-containing protein [Verrucomicrobiales bacterium]
MSEQYVVAEKPLILLEQVISIARLIPSDLLWVFRGHANCDWDLLPSAGRKPHFVSSSPPDPSQPSSRKNPPPDLGRFNHWRDLASAYRQVLPQNDFECLALAQHYGLPTRLLDFSSNILVALYFACESDFDSDGCIFAFLPDLFIDPEICSFYDIPESGILRVRPFERRFLQQSAQLMYFKDPATPLRGKRQPAEMEEFRKAANLPDSSLIKFLIPKKSKVYHLNALERIGVSRSTLFPDLEGLSQQFVLNDVLDSLRDDLQTDSESLEKA